MSRKKSREFAFRMIFENFFHQFNEFEMIDEDLMIDESHMPFVNSLVGGVNEHKDEILSIIKVACVGYELERIYKVDLAILMLAVFELKFDQSTPPSVVINEAVELSKKYSTDKSYSFVNGILAKVVANE